jgi:hypothetical protein
MEIEITVKWLLSGDSNKRLDQYVRAIHIEEERLGRKLSDGFSVSAQIMNELFGEHLKQRRASHARAGSPTSGRKSGWPPVSIREMSKEVNLERNYELGYWIESVYAHAHPLSILEAHPSDWDHVLCSMFTCEARNGLPRFICVLALPSSILHVFAALDEVLSVGLQAEITRAWEAINELGRKEMGGNVEFSVDLPVGEVHVNYTDGSSRRYSPKASSKTTTP